MVVDQFWIKYGGGGYGICGIDMNCNNYKHLLEILFLPFYLTKETFKTSINSFPIFDYIFANSPTIAYQS